MKIVSTFTWPGGTVPAFVTDTGDVWIYQGVSDKGGLDVRRFTLRDIDTDKPAIPTPQLASGDAIVVLYVQNDKQIWKPHVVEYIGVTSFQYRNVHKEMGTLLFIDEGKHWRRA